jgi:ribonuclease BN (tRNA processing enzyme)
MDVTILGSGTLLPDDARRSPAHLVEAARFRLLLDCGSGTVHGMARDEVAWRDLTHVAVSHFHTDHTGDLAPLLWALRHGAEGREAPLVLLGPPGMARLVRALAEAHGEFVLDPGFPVEVVELARHDRYVDGDAGLDLRTHPARHTEEAVAFRVAAEGLSMGYTGDTGPHPPLGVFFRGVDLLVAECAVRDDRELEIHLSPRSVAALLRDARPGVAVLTHLYPELDPGRVADLVRDAGFTGEVRVARDGLRIHLSPRGGGGEGPEAG